MRLTEFLLARYDEHLARAWERGAAPGSAFVRDEYESLKRIVDLHPCDDCGHAVDDPCQTLRLLAVPYAYRDDYDERWRA